MEKENMNSSQGFTIMEVLIALVILSVGLLGAASMQYSSSKYNRNSRDGTEASTLASDCAERLMNMNYNDLEDDDEQQGRFTITWTITETDLSVPTDGINDAKYIVVTVTSPGNRRVFNLNSLKTREVR